MQSMATPKPTPPAPREPIPVTPKDLPLHCPLPQQSLWNSHPRVFLDIETTGHARCPYCGSEYRLNP